MVDHQRVTLTPGERIAKIREAATLLDKHEWPDIDLVLDQHGLPTTDEWDGGGAKSSYVIAMVKNASDDALAQLHQYLVGETTGRPVGNSPWLGGKLRIFFSHLAQNRQFVAEVGNSIAMFGVEPFIAHDAIEPSAEWVSVIEASLSDCDALVAFLHPGFLQSGWCDQEVGWVLARKRPVLPLGLGLSPYGLLGKYQALHCAGANPYQVGRLIVDWLTRTPSLLGRMSTGLVDAFVNSRSWDFTRSIVPLMERMESVTDDDLSRMEQAARDNIDVRECGIPPDPTGPQWVARYVKQRRGPTSAPTWPSVTADAPF